MADKKISALTGAATPLDGTEVLPIVQSGATVKVANNDLRPKQIQSNATSGVLQVVGPASAATRVMTTPDANFTAARTDASQTFNNIQTFLATASSNSDARWTEVVSDDTAVAANNGGGILFRGKYTGTTLVDAASIQAYKENATDGQFGYGLRLVTRADGGSLTAGLEQRPNGDVVSRVGNFIVGTSGKGIDFSATAGTGTSELLADYEEGTWTPTVFGSTGAGTYELSANTSCSYQKVGNNVTVLARIVAAAVVTGGGTGDIRISGLPFNMSATVYGSPFAAVCSGVAFTGSFLAAERVTGGATATVYPYGIDNAGAQTQVPIANFAANDIISFQFQYRV